MNKKTLIVAGTIFGIIAVATIYELVSGKKIPGQEFGEGMKVEFLVSDRFAEFSAYSGKCDLPKVVREKTNSSYCLSCHDGTVTKMTPIHDAAHSVGKRVPPGAYGFQPVLARELVLVNGKIECTSCHNYWAVPRQPAWMAMPAKDICNGCHNK